MYHARWISIFWLKRPSSLGHRPELATRAPILINVIACALIICSCSSTSVNFRSSPQKAAVSVKPLGSGANKNLGDTPLTVSAAEIEKEFQGSGPITVEFTKEGYKTVRMLITELSSLDLTLDVELQPASGLEDPVVLNAGIEKLFDAQRLIKTQRFDEALKLLDEVRRSSPQLSASYELLGGVYFLQGKKLEALDSYRAAARLNPRSTEATRMRDMIETQALGRMPASSAEGAKKP